MYMVYWTSTEEGSGLAHSEAFGSEEMVAAMRLMEELRTRQRNGEAIGFITMASENPDSVGRPGVDDPPSDYQWRKRRP